MQIGHVPEIQKIKTHLDDLKERKLIQEWELPYEDILTRLTAAVFFITPAEGIEINKIWDELQVYNRLQYRLNEQKKMSPLSWRVEFNKDFDL